MSLPGFRSILKETSNAKSKLVLLECTSRYTIHSGESRDLNDRPHGISCRYSDKTSKQTYHIFLNTKPNFIKQSAHTS